MDFDRLSAKHKDEVYRQMVRVCGNYDDADDALAEALIAAYRYSRQLRDTSSFPAWLATIGRRACGRIKSRRDLSELETLGFEPVSSESPEAQVELRELKSCIQAAVEGLPRNLRDVYVRRELNGTPAEAVAVELGLSVPAVKTRLHRARQRMREQLDREICQP